LANLRARTYTGQSSEKLVMTKVLPALINLSTLFLVLTPAPPVSTIPIINNILFGKPKAMTG
jgi:hypothetical protein